MAPLLIFIKKISNLVLAIESILSKDFNVSEFNVLNNKSYLNRLIAISTAIKTSLYK